MSNNLTILPSMPPPPAHWTQAAELTPPPVPTNKNIYVFGRPINMSYEERLEQDAIDIAEKTNKGKIETRVDHLKQINRSLLVKLVQLTKVLVESPSDYEEKVRELKAVILNFQFLLNQYRPHEARETIITMLEKQLERRKEVSNVLKERIAAADAKIEDAKERLSKQINRINSEVLPPTSEVILPETGLPKSSHQIEVTETPEIAEDRRYELDCRSGLDFLLPQLETL